MSNIRERRQARFDRNKIKKSDDLYKSNDPGVDISSERTQYKKKYQQIQNLQREDKPVL